MVLYNNYVQLINFFNEIFVTFRPTAWPTVSITLRVQQSVIKRMTSAAVK